VSWKQLLPRKLTELEEFEAKVRAEEASYEDSRTVPIGDGNVSLDEFLSFHDKLGCKLALRNGQVIIIEVPTSVAHKKAQGKIIGQLDAHRCFEQYL